MSMFPLMMRLRLNDEAIATVPPAVVLPLVSNVMFAVAEAPS
jgi:hypothetical protein